jgi:hypothetical protein
MEIMKHKKSIKWDKVAINFTLLCFRVTILVFLITLITWRVAKKPFAEGFLKHQILLSDTVKIGNIDINILDKFPNASIQVKNISIRGTNSTTKQVNAFEIATAEVEISLKSFYDKALFGILKRNPHIKKWIKKEHKVVIELERLYFDSLKADLEIDSLGQQNYLIFNPDSIRLTQLDKRPDTVRIKNLYLTNSFVNYQDKHIPDSLLAVSRNKINSDSLREVYALDRHYRLQIDTVDLSLRMTKNFANIKVNQLAAKSHFLSYNSVKIFEDTDFRLQGYLSLDKKPRDLSLRKQAPTRLSIDTLTLQVANTTLGVTGGFESRKIPIIRKGKEIWKNSSFFALSFYTLLNQTGTTLAEIDKILRVVSKETADLLKDFDIKGELELRAELDGADTFDEDPHFELYFKSKNISFSPKMTLFSDNDRVSNLFMEGRFSNGLENSMQTSFVEIGNIKGELARLPFKGTLRLDNFLEPDKLLIKSDLGIKGFPLKTLLSLAKTVEYDSAYGAIDLVLNIEGLLKDIDISTIDKVKYGGKIDLNGIHFSTHTDKGIPLNLSKVKGEFNINNSNFYIPNYAPFRGYLNNQEFVLEGVIHEIAQYIVKKSNNLNPTFKADLQLSTYDFNITSINDSISAWTYDEHEVSIPKDTNSVAPPSFYFDFYSLAQKLNLDVNLALKINNLSLQKPYNFSFEQFLSEVQYRDNTLNIKGLQLSDGQDTLSLDMAFDAISKKENHVETRLKFTIKNVNPFVKEFVSDETYSLLKNWNLGTHGEMNLIASIRENNEMTLKFKLNELDVLNKKKKLNLQNLSFNTKFNQAVFSPEKPLNIKIKNIYFEIDEQAIEGELLFEERTKHPYLDLHLKSTDEFKLQTLEKYLSLSEKSAKLLEDLTNIKGSISFDTHLQGQIDSAKSFLYLPQTGKVEVNHVGFDLGGRNPLPFQNFNGTISFGNDSIKINKLKGNLGESDFAIEGHTFGLLPFIFDSKSLNADLNLTSNYLNINEIIPNLQDRDTLVDEGANILLDLISKAKLNAKLNVRKAHYHPQNKKELEFENLYATINSINGITVIDTMGVNFISSQIKAKAIFDVRDSSRVGMGGEFFIDNLKMDELFDALDDSLSIDIFDTLSYSGINLDGVFSTQMSFSDTIIYDSTWVLGSKTSASIDTLTWLNGKITNPKLLNVNGVWKSLPWAARKGVKVLFGIDKDNLLSPSPYFMICAGDINLVDRKIYLHKLNFESNKLFLKASGLYDLDIFETDIDLSLLRLSKSSLLTQHLHRDYRYLENPNFKRATLNPKFKYIYFRRRKQEKTGKQGKLKLELRLLKKSKL